MHLFDMQLRKKKFDEERGWNEFSLSQVYVHLTEEIGEIGRYILYVEGYKKQGLGHAEPPGSVDREFAQSLGLILQLANMTQVDLEKAYRKELKIMKGRFPAKEWREYATTRPNYRNLARRNHLYKENL